MGSPFDKFRKHQKRLLVFLGVVCMVAFVFAGVQCSGPGMATTRPFMEVEGEVITQGDLKKWLDDRRLVGRVASLIQQETGRSFNFGRATEEEVVTLILLVRLGGELGIRVTDAQINQFLSQYTQGKVSASQIRSVLQETGATEADLFRAMRHELIAAQVLVLFVPPGNPTVPSGALALEVDRLAGGLSQTSPSMLWDVFLKVNRLAQLEALPFRVEESLGSVGSPDEETLRKFFEEHKERLPDPDSPTPGFRRPHRVKLRWIRIPYQQIFDQMLAEVTEEEIRRYYEENKERFLYTPLSAEPPRPSLPLVAPDPKPRDAQPEDSNSSAEGRASQQSPEERPKAKEKENAGRKQSRRFPLRGRRLVQRAAAVAAGPLSLMVLQAGQEEEETEQQRSESSSGQPAQGDGQPGRQTSQPQEKAGEQQFSLSLMASELQVPDDVRAGPNPKYDPLWKVEDRIRRELAQQKANQRMVQIARELLDPLARFSQQWVRWDASGRKGPEPQMPDLSPLLSRYQLKLEESPLVDADELFEKYPLGKAYLGQPDPQFGWRRTLAVLPVVFQHLGVFQVEQARDLENNHYVFWKVEDRPSYVPTLDEVREEVVRVWRLKEAAKVALAGAEGYLRTLRGDEKPDLAREARVTGKPLIRPQPFSWWESRGFMQYGISQVPELGPVDEEFMKTIFSLEPGELALVSNRPETVYYIVRLLGFEYRGGMTEEQARLAFRRTMEMVTRERPLSSQLFMARGPFLFATQQQYMDYFQAWRTYLFERYQVRRLDTADSEQAP